MFSEKEALKKPNKEMLECRFIGGSLLGGAPIEFCRSAAIDLNTLDDENKARVEQAISSLKGPLTYIKAKTPFIPDDKDSFEHHLIGSWGAQVMHDNNKIFNTQYHKAVPDQYWELRDMVLSLSRIQKKGNGWSNSKES